MASAINLPAYTDALVVLGTAGVVVPLVRKLGVSPVLGYLCAGVILGPLGLGSLSHDIPILKWLAVTDARNIDGISELGVVFMLFLIGLELSYERLKAMRRLVFGLGMLQVMTAALVIGAFAAQFDIQPSTAILIGACLALSSTAIIIEELSSQKRMATNVGRTTFSVLLAQDLAVIPILVFISTVGEASGDTLALKVAMAGAKAVIAVLIIILLGRLALRPLFRLVVNTDSDEIFIAAILFVIVATGVVAASADLSMALGAFVAGLLLAETEYRKAIEAAIDPFKGLLLGVFFFTVGTNIDLRELAAAPNAVLAGVAGLIAMKTLLFIGLARLYRQSWPIAIESGLLLGPGGEFALVGIGLAASLSLVKTDIASYIFVVTALSMAMIPLTSWVGRRISKRMTPAKVADPVTLIQPGPTSGHVIVVGHGRVGSIVTLMLDRHNYPFIAIDGNPNNVALERRDGREVYYGDASDRGFLKTCGLDTARALIITVHDHAAIDTIIQTARRERSDLPIVVRAKNRAHARHLYAIGATDAVPETLEASLQLSEASLLAIGIAAGPVIASIHEQRDEFRADLQQAASTASGTSELPVGTHAIRAKTVHNSP